MLPKTIFDFLKSLGLLAMQSNDLFKNNPADLFWLLFFLNISEGFPLNSEKAFKSADSFPNLFNLL